MVADGFGPVLEPLACRVTNDERGTSPTRDATKATHHHRRALVPVSRQVLAVRRAFRVSLHAPPRHVSTQKGPGPGPARPLYDDVRSRYSCAADVFAARWALSRSLPWRRWRPPYVLSRACVGRRCFPRCSSTRGSISDLLGRVAAVFRLIHDSSCEGEAVRRAPARPCRMPCLSEPCCGELSLQAPAVLVVADRDDAGWSATEQAAVPDRAPGRRPSVLQRSVPGDRRGLVPLSRRVSCPAAF